MKKIFAVILILTFLSTPSFGADAEIKGKYEVIGSTEGLKGASQVELVELFNFSCGHCYRFLETSKKLRKKYGAKLFHKKYPIYWGEQTAYPAMAFYISDSLGMEEKFTQELFDTNFKLNINIFRSRVVKLLAKDYGIDKEMSSGMQSKKIEAKVNKGLQMARDYEANETPTIIVNNVLKVTPSLSGGDVVKMTENLDLIIGDILGMN
jgi:protein dithiol oxidoreductase (disulfide-forming)